MDGSPPGVDGVLDVDSGRGEDEPAPDEYRQTLAEADGGHAEAAGEIEHNRDNC